MSDQVKIIVINTQKHNYLGTDPETKGQTTQKAAAFLPTADHCCWYQTGSPQYVRNY